MRVVSLLFALLVNAIPLYGVHNLGWSASTVIALYWVENLAIGVFTCARIALHRKLTRKRGHWRGGTMGVKVNDRPLKTGLLGEYAVLAFGFTLAHGVFVAAFVFIGASNHDSPAWQFSREQFTLGVQWLLVALTLEFLLDLTTLRSRSFAWIKGYVGQRSGRVLIMHFVIIIGMFAMMATESPFAMLYVLIALKTLWDVFASGTAAPPQALPTEPPVWIATLADNTAKGKHGADEIRRDWKRSRDDMIRAAQEDEEVMPG